MNRLVKLIPSVLIAVACGTLSAEAAKTWQQNIDEGEAKYESGDLKGAETYFQEAMKEAQKFPADDIRLARTLNNMGVILDHSGKYAEAESMYQKALKIRQSKLGKNDPAVADTLNNLANLYKDQKKYKEAEPLYTRALAIYATIPKGGGFMAMGLNNLSVLHTNQGRTAEAESDLKRGIEYGEKSLGLENDHVIDMVSKLAAMYDKAGKSAEAKPYFKKYLKSVYKAMEISDKDPDAHAKAKKFAAALRTAGQAGDADLVDKAIQYESK